MLPSRTHSGNLLTPLLSLCALYYILFFLFACASTQTRQAKPSVPFLLQEEDTCARFQDQRTALSFCMPKQTKMRLVGLSPNPFTTRFEAILQSDPDLVELRLRKDPLLAESTPEGALQSAWLLRYGISYAKRRGAKASQIRSRTLHPKRLAFFHADAAVWLSFPIADQRFAREEVLILAQRPLTRYLFSLRITHQADQPDQYENLRQILHTFLQKLRLKA
ncbi:MAG: hypothetical protein H6728_11570 [Myxococcales bacterium]|nr:hypothetical protein [Myxococcales bacterium]